MRAIRLADVDEPAAAESEAAIPENLTILADLGEFEPAAALPVSDAAEGPQACRAGKAVLDVD